MNGWICPKCGRVYGPMVQECWFCNGNTQTVTVTWGTGVNNNG